MTFYSYIRYLLDSKCYVLLVVGLILFFIAEAANTLFFRFLAQYDTIKSNSNALFTSNSFWLTLSMLQLAYFIILVIKYFILNIIILNSNKHIHSKMLNSLIRSPS